MRAKPALIRARRLPLAALAALLFACAPGTRATAHPCGSPRTQFELDGGRREHGAWRSFYPVGTPRELGQYEHGRRSGLWTTRYRNGMRESEGERRWSEARRESVRHGEWTFWYRSGLLRRQGRYEEGLESGPWECWNFDGEPDLDRSGVYERGRRARPLETAPRRLQASEAGR